jgi:hypothetical protein
MGKQKQRRAGRVKVNPEFKNLVRRLKRPPLTTGWHCNLWEDNTKPTNGQFPPEHSVFVHKAGVWFWLASEAAYILWTKYPQQYKAWCKIKG